MTALWRDVMALCCLMARIPKRLQRLI
ncbi:protein MpPOD43 [Marchantia polymorpha subsp. ruderalis]